MLICSSLANLVRGALGQMKNTYSGVPTGSVAYLASLCLIVTRIVTTQQKQLRVSTSTGWYLLLRQVVAKALLHGNAEFLWQKSM